MSADRNRATLAIACPVRLNFHQTYRAQLSDDSLRVIVIVRPGLSCNLGTNANLVCLGWYACSLLARMVLLALGCRAKEYTICLHEGTLGNPEVIYVGVACHARTGLPQGSPDRGTCSNEKLWRSHA